MQLPPDRRRKRACVQRHVGVEAATTAAAPSGCSTRRRAPARTARLRWCRRRRCRPARSRTRASRTRSSSAAPGRPRCARRARCPARTSGGTGRPRAGRRVDGVGGAARVVAVEAAAGVDEELGLRQRPGDQTQLGLTQRVAGAPQLAASVARRPSIAHLVGAQADDRAQPWRPVLERVLAVDAGSVSRTWSSRGLQRSRAPRVSNRPTRMRSLRSCTPTSLRAVNAAELGVDAWAGATPRRCGSSRCLNWSPSAGRRAHR